VAARVADALEQRAALLESDLLLLAENAETQRWLGQRNAAGGDSTPAREADRFLREAWTRMSASYASLAYRDPEGRDLYSLGQAPASPSALLPVERPVVDVRTGANIGSVLVRPALQSMLPLDLLATGFGRTGHGVVVDRSAGRVVYHPDPALQGSDLATLMRTERWELEVAQLGQPTGRFRYHTGDTIRVASWAAVRGLPWTVIVSGRLDEFSGPFTEVRRTTLLLFLVVAALAAIAFSLLLRRTTRSLVDLTEATAVVGDGDFTPRLPQAGRDEVGRLTIAFSAMATRVREMVSEIRTSRQMAVLGEFAAHLAHEIRNPLTSIKLNLQKLERERAAGRLPESAAKPLEISLREVGRLDTVVRGVLELGRSRAVQPEPCALRRVAGEAIDVVTGQADARGVRIEPRWAADADAVFIDPGMVKGGVLNVLLNAVEAMPGGGVILVTTEDGPGGSVLLRISDTGPGIAAERRAAVFRPFVTGKEHGTGLGLPLARQAIEDNGGTLGLSDTADAESGAEFVIAFPRYRAV